MSTTAIYGSYPLSDNEITKLRSSEITRRRRLRLLQVRQQEKELAARRRKRSKLEAQKREKRRLKEERREWNNRVSQDIDLLKKKYKEALNRLGSAHNSAQEEKLRIESANHAADLRAQKAYHQAEMRYQEALESQKSQKLSSLAYNRQIQSIRRKQAHKQASKKEGAKNLNPAKEIEVQPSIGLSNTSLPGVTQENDNIESRRMKAHYSEIQNHDPLESAKFIQQSQQTQQGGLSEQFEKDRLIAAQRGRKALQKLKEIKAAKAIEESLDQYVQQQAKSGKGPLEIQANNEYNLTNIEDLAGNEKQKIREKDAEFYGKGEREVKGGNGGLNRIIESSKSEFQSLCNLNHMESGEWVKQKSQNSISDFQNSTNAVKGFAEQMESITSEKELLETDERRKSSLIDNIEEELDESTKLLLEESRAARQEAKMQIREILDLGRSTLNEIEPKIGRSMVSHDSIGKGNTLGDMIERKSLVHSNTTGNTKDIASDSNLTYEINQQLQASLEAYLGDNNSDLIDDSSHTDGTEAAPELKRNSNVRQLAASVLEELSCNENSTSMMQNRSDETNPPFPKWCSSSDSIQEGAEENNMEAHSWKDDPNLGNLASKVHDFLKASTENKDKKKNGKGQSDQKEFEDLEGSASATNIQEKYNSADMENLRESEFSNNSVSSSSLSREQIEKSATSNSLSSYAIDEFEQRLINVLNTLKATRLENEITQNVMADSRKSNADVLNLGSLSVDEDLEEREVEQYPLLESASQGSSRTEFTEQSFEISSVGNEDSTKLLLGKDILDRTNSSHWFNLQTFTKEKADLLPKNDQSTNQLFQSPSVMHVSSTEVPNSGNLDKRIAISSVAATSNVRLKTAGANGTRGERTTETKQHAGSSSKRQKSEAPSGINEFEVHHEKNNRDSIKENDHDGKSIFEKAVEIFDANERGDDEQRHNPSKLQDSLNVVEESSQKDHAPNANFGANSSSSINDKSAIFAKRSQDRARRAKEIARQRVLKEGAYKSTVRTGLSKNPVLESTESGRDRILKRLVQGEKLKISKSESFKRSKKLYDKLPEIREQQREREKKEFAKERRAKARKLDEERRLRLLRSRKSGKS